MGNIFQRQPIEWNPSADEFNCPSGTLLRADNLILDKEGAVGLRPGSSILDTLAGATDVHSLFHSLISGTLRRFAGVDAKLFLNGADLGLTFDGSGEISMGDTLGYVFAARGTTTKQWNPTTGAQEWGLPQPTQKPTLESVPAITRNFATCNNAESPGFVKNEGTQVQVDGYDGTVNGAINLAPSGKGRASTTKTFAADTDFFTISGAPGQDNDLFDMMVAVDKAQDVKQITVMIGLNGSATDPFRDDYYYYDFNVGDAGKVQSTVDVKDAAGLIAKSKSQSVDSLIDTTTPGSDPLNIDELLDILDKPRERTAKRRERKDAVASPAWFHLSVPRGQFNRVGGTDKKDWSKVKAVKIVVTTVPGSTGTLSFDNVQMFGGGDRAFTGNFKIRYRWVRTNGTFVEKSPPSPASDLVAFDLSAARVTIPAAAFVGLDSSINQCWVYMYGGYMNAYYRVAVTGASANSGAKIRLDQFAKIADGGSTASDRKRINTLRFSVPGDAGNGNLVADILSSEIIAIQTNIRLEPGCVPPPDNIIGIIGEWNQRTWCLTSDGYVYASLFRNPSVFNAIQAVRVGDPAATPYWIAKTSGGLYVGTSEDIIRISGSAGENPDGTLQVLVESTNEGNPPVDGFLAQEGNQIVYRSDDGLRFWTGQASVPVPRLQVDLLWRGYTRHGVSPLNTATGRFRGCMQRGVINMIAPEGASTTSSQVLHRYDIMRNKWYRHTFPPSFRSIITDQLGRVVLGDTVGRVWVIDTGTADDAAKIPAVLWTKNEDGGNPLMRKDALDLQCLLDTGGDNATIDVHKNGATGSSLTVSGVSSNGVGRYFKDISEAVTATLKGFRQLQLKVTGSFNTLEFKDWLLSFRERPQTCRAADSGYFFPTRDADYLWARKIRICCIAEANFTVKTYLDGVLYDTSTVTASAGVEKIYNIDMPDKEGMGSVGRILVESAGTAGVTEVGLEIFWAEVRQYASGDGMITEKDKIKLNLSPAGENG